MKIYAEYEDGARVEIKEIESVSKDCDIIILKSNRLLSDKDKILIEKYMSTRIGKSCIVIDGLFDKVLGI